MFQGEWSSINHFSTSSPLIRRLSLCLCLMGDGKEDMYEGFGSIDVEYVSTAYNSDTWH